MVHRTLGLAVLVLLLVPAGLTAQATGSDGPPVVEVTGTDYEFQMPATELRSGWTTFAFDNRGTERHELVFARLPEEGSYGELRRFLGAVDTLQSTLQEGAIDSATYLEALKKHRPAWVPDLEASGLLALAPERSARITLKLEPGAHQVICFLPDSAGEPHWQRGMRTRMDVTEETNGVSPPEADARVTVSDSTISTRGRMGSGTRTVAIRFGERSAPAQASSSPPVFLVRLSEGTTVQDVRDQVGGLGGSTLEGAESVGGVLPTPSAATVYLTVDVEPGRYAWVGPQDSDMAKTFRVR